MERGEEDLWVETPPGPFQKDALQRGTSCTGGASALTPVKGPDRAACHVCSAGKGKRGRMHSEGEGEKGGPSLP